MTLRNYSEDMDIQGCRYFVTTRSLHFFFYQYVQFSLRSVTVLLDGCLAVASLAWYPGNRERLLRIGGLATLEQAALRFSSPAYTGKENGNMNASSHTNSATHANITQVIARAKSQLSGEAGYCRVM